MDRNTIIGLVLIAIVFLLWMYYVGENAPEPQVMEVPVDTVGQAADIPPDERSELGKAESPITDVADSLVAVRDTMPADTITIETDLYRATMVTKGAGLISYVLKEFSYLDEEDGPIEMIHSGGLAVPNFRFDNKNIDLAYRNFEVNRTSLDLSGAESGQIEFDYEFATGETARKVYTFYGDRYRFGLDFEMDGIQSLGLEDEYEVFFEPGIEPTEKNRKDDINNFHANALLGNDIEKFDDFENGRIHEDIEGLTDWIATRTKYFCVALMPTSRDAIGMTVDGTRRMPDEDRGIEGHSHIGVSLQMKLGQRDNLFDAYTIYIGPLDYGRLSDFGNRLEDILDLGWSIIKPFSKAVTWMMIQFHKVIPNYGLVIIIFALIVKVAFSPLSYISMKSMRRMQDIQPKVTELKEKYKKEPQKMNQEVLKLYRQYKINPLSGCLPLLAQAPIFFALFTVFRTTIEFRGAPFILWIQDLSQPDPYYVLPVFMAVTMFVQQKMTMKDPKQKFMIYIFPAVFLWWGIQFPAGLCLYWAITNLLAFFEAIFVHKRHVPLEDPQPETDDKGSKKGSKKNKQK